MPYSTYTLYLIFESNEGDEYISLDFDNESLGTVREIAEIISKLADDYSGKADVWYNPENKPILFGWYIKAFEHYKKESAYCFFGVNVEEYKGIIERRFKKEYRVECEESLRIIELIEEY